MACEPNKPVSPDSLKRMLRRIKKDETALRDNLGLHGFLVWNAFFSTSGNIGKGRVKYPLEALFKLNSEQINDIITEYFFEVTHRYFGQTGAISTDYEPALLEKMGLPPYAGSDDIRKRFRQLAKEYHPDAGGSEELFVALMDTYEKLKKAEDA